MQDPSITCVYIYIMHLEDHLCSLYLPIYLSTYLCVRIYDPIMPQRSSTGPPGPPRVSSFISCSQICSASATSKKYCSACRVSVAGWVQWIRCWKRNGTPSEGISCNQKMGTKGHVFRYGAPEFANETERKKQRENEFSDWGLLGVH